MSSGKYKPHRGFNPIQIKDGMVVRLRKNGTVKTVLGIHTPLRVLMQVNPFILQMVRIRSSSLAMVMLTLMK